MENEMMPLNDAAPEHGAGGWSKLAATKIQQGN